MSATAEQITYQIQRATAESRVPAGVRMVLLASLRHLHTPEAAHRELGMRISHARAHFTRARFLGLLEASGVITAKGWQALHDTALEGGAR